MNNRRTVVIFVKLYCVVFRSGNDFVLELFGHVVEVVAVTGNADKEVFVLVGMLLCIEKGLCVNDVELDVMTTELEICANHRRAFLDVVVTLEQLWCETHVEQRTAALRLVEFAERLNHSRWSVGVAAVCG